MSIQLMYRCMVFSTIVASSGALRAYASARMYLQEP
jgi:hypothetical protein